VVGNRNQPENISELEKHIAQVSAHNAVLKPDRVSVTDEESVFKKTY